MTKKQLSTALAMAQNKAIRFIDDDGKHLEDISHFDGYGLAGFEPIHCTIRQLAFLIRWQCVRSNGTVDADELNNLAAVGSKKFIVLDDPLLAMIEDVEKAHFRTVNDTGAHSTAMLIWNIVRKHAGLSPLTLADLPSWCQKCRAYHKGSDLCPDLKLVSQR